jgi:hypothetical protein
MSDIFAMRRANGDWFALEDYGRLRSEPASAGAGALHGRAVSYIKVFWSIRLAAFS